MKPSNPAPICAVILLLSVSGGAQADTGPGWTAFASGILWDLRAVAALDANTVIAVGDVGTIVRTTDRGASWAIQGPATTASLRAISFSDAKTGTIVGTQGLILRTEDAGARWREQSGGTAADLCGVAFRDAQTGVAVGTNGSCDVPGFSMGGEILRTTDGGVTWTRQVTDTPRLWAVSFADAQTVVAVGDRGTVLRSTDAGAIWGPVKYLGGGVRAVFFPTAEVGFAVGGTGLSRTTDGGVTWESVSSGYNTGGAPFRGLYFSDAKNGSVVGDGGLILRTTDGGSAWRTQTSGVIADLHGVVFSNAISGWAAGDGGLVVRTTTGGDPGPVVVSAASLTAPLAPGSLASLVGSRHILSNSTAVAEVRSPPTTLGGVSVRVRDSAGQARLAPAGDAVPAWTRSTFS